MPRARAWILKWLSMAYAWIRESAATTTIRLLAMEGLPAEGHKTVVGELLGRATDHD